ncbi:MAG: tRNA pseudouridine(55) synthase TruB [Acidimicrobiia bacterium]|nr:tRNA pseudouridine(55) synthase TruB [Acidimicrobiia bacterium]MBT8218023.1 tRNA pseudouridine(55) synthase TruB [Acidimicrobiia bacterium]NNF09383.1 tRNA pseudouridine(55) synthase TruB [Acidimicrobiia bacterium]NNL71178.1 tRNA pseudouridine(55) synthase TruB [Acidimicrobiia bacterium]
MSYEGFLLVDKPTEWTSHDVVARVRRLAEMKKVGHAGTLDPMATGLLVLGLGRVTRLLRFIQDQPKEYVATARFGVATDTLDADGTVTDRSPLPVGQTETERALAGFRGEITQIPPMTSAIKVGGQKLYELARRGEEIERPARTVTIFELEMTGFSAGDFPEVDFRVVCSSGTYVRTLADDIARALGGRAHLTALRRTRIGSLHVENASTMEELAEPGRLAGSILAPASGLAGMETLQVEEPVAARVRHGSKLPVDQLPVDGHTAILDGDGRLLAVYRREDSVARAEVVLS